MANVFLVGAFEQWLSQSTRSRDLRNKCIQIVQRLLHRGLAISFDSYAAAVEEIRERRLSVQRTLARWKTPYARKAFDLWLE